MSRRDDSPITQFERAMAARKHWTNPRNSSCLVAVVEILAFLAFLAVVVRPI